MENSNGINELAKERLRDRIARQVQMFLESGGSITVVETPKPKSIHHRGSIWDNASELPTPGD